jgi:hypothetical protein
MSESLKEILANGIVRRVEEYDWRGSQYLRVFMNLRGKPVWDGPKTPETARLINDKYNFQLCEKKKGTR